MATTMTDDDDDDGDEDEDDDAIDLKAEGPLHLRAKKFSSVFPISVLYVGYSEQPKSRYRRHKASISYRFER
jgi:hypothetical protein